MHIELNPITKVISKESFECPNLWDCKKIETALLLQSSGASLEGHTISTEGLVHDLFKKLYEWFLSFFKSKEKTTEQIKQDLTKQVTKVKKIKSEVPASEMYKARNKDAAAMIHNFKKLPVMMSHIATVQSKCLEAYTSVQDSINLALVEKDTKDSLKTIASKLKECIKDGYIVPDGFLGEVSKGKVEANLNGFVLNVEVVESNIPPDVKVTIEECYDFAIKHERDLDNVHTKLLETMGVLRKKFKELQEKVTKAEKTEGRQVKSVKEQVSAHNLILKIMTTLVNAVEKYQRTLTIILKNVNALTEKLANKSKGK